MNGYETFIIACAGFVGDVIPVLLFVGVLSCVVYFGDKYMEMRNKIETDEDVSPIFDAYQSWDHTDTTTFRAADGSFVTVIVTRPERQPVQTDYVKRWWGD